MRLTARRGARCGFPGGDRFIRKPHGQTAPLPQRLIIIGPVRHASLRPRNVVAASGIARGSAVAKDIRLAEMLIAKGARPDPAALAQPQVKLKSLLAA